MFHTREGRILSITDIGTDSVELYIPKISLSRLPYRWINQKSGDSNFVPSIKQEPGTVYIETDVVVKPEPEVKMEVSDFPYIFPRIGLRPSRRLRASRDPMYTYEFPSSDFTDTDSDIDYEPNSEPPNHHHDGIQVRTLPQTVTRPEYPSTNIDIEKSNLHRNLSCTVCCIEFDSKSELRSHFGSLAHAEKLVGKGNQSKFPYPCRFCGQLFKKARVRETHESEHKAFVCPVCPSRFSQSGQLPIHMRIHRNERPFPCPTCGRRFNQKSHMNRHVKIHSTDHHLPNSIPEYACDICPNRRFSERSNLIRHLNAHKKGTLLYDSCKRSRKKERNL